MRLRDQVRAGSAPEWAIQLWPKLVRLVPALEARPARRALDATGWKRKAAARRLGIAHSTLPAKVRN